MSRVAVDWRSASKEVYNDFCKNHPLIKLTFNEWRNIIYEFNDNFKYHILETGDKERLPCGFGEFSINKKKRRIIQKDTFLDGCGLKKKLDLKLLIFGILNHLDLHQDLYHII
jgi:hypothetical protein